MARSNIISGAKLAVFVNGKRFATVTDVVWTSDTPREALRVVDSIEAWELAPTITRVSGTLSLIRQTADGGAEGVGLVAPLSELTRERYFSLAVIEHNTDIVIFQAQRCSVTSQTWRAAARGILTGSVNFEAIEYANETELLRP